MQKLRYVSTKDVVPSRNYKRAENFESTLSVSLRDTGGVEEMLQQQTYPTNSTKAWNGAKADTSTPPTNPFETQREIKISIRPKMASIVAKLTKDERKKPLNPFRVKPIPVCPSAVFRRSS